MNEEPFYWVENHQSRCFHPPWELKSADKTGLSDGRSCTQYDRPTNSVKSLLCGIVNRESSSVSCLRRCNQQLAVTRCLPWNLSELFDPLRVTCPVPQPYTYGTACYFHIINVGITKAITVGLMTEAEQGVQHDARVRVRRRRRVVIHGSASHMMRSSFPDRGCLYSLPLKFQIYKLPGRKAVPHIRSPSPCCK
jgi:hypothetical protein